MRFRTLATMLAVVLASASTVFADEGFTAQQIVERMLEQDAFGWDNAEASIRMSLVDKDGSKRERMMENLSRKKDGQLQTVVRFRAPQDVAGTAFLILQRKDGDSEQFVYLPGLKRTRRIAGREREGSFMGSDFSYADFERRDTRDATHERLPDEEISGIKTYVITSKPKPGTDSAYSRIMTWVRQDNFLPLRTRFYDKNGELLKTLYTKRIKEVSGRQVIVEANMSNKQTGHSTDLFVDNLKELKEISDALFTPTALEHG